MVVVMGPGVDEAQIEEVATRLRLMGLAVHRTDGKDRIIARRGRRPGRARRRRRAPPARRRRTSSASPCPYKLVSRAFQPRVDGRHRRPTPRSAATRSRSWPARARSRARSRSRPWPTPSPRSGATILRGGAYKPRTSPYTFQGLGEEGLQDPAPRRRPPRPRGHLRGDRHPARRRSLERWVDMPAGRRAQHAELRAAARGRPARRKPVLLKRGFSAHDRGVADVRRVHPRRRQPPGHPVRARHPHVRDDAAQHARPLVRAAWCSSSSHLPVVVDPSHAVGVRDKVPPMALRRRRRRRRRPA